MSIISPVATDASGNPKVTGSMQALGKDDFLQLLVTKLQHQDPLNPTEDAEFIAQLAQFSTLEQMNNISEGIQASNQWDYLQTQSLNNVMAAGFIGKEVRAEFTGVYAVDDNQPVISFTTDRFAAEIEFEIRDETGTLVRTLTAAEVAPGTGQVTWDGKDDQGNRVAEGFYEISATAEMSTGEQFTPQLSLIGLVSTVNYRDGQAFLTVNGTEIALGDVTAVGEQGSFSEEE